MSTFNKYSYIFLYLLVVICSVNAVSAYYIADVYFTVPDNVYTTGERIEFKGYLYETNYSSNGTLVSASAVKASAIVNLTITGADETVYTNISFTTDSAGSFYSKSNFYGSATEVLAPSAEGKYRIRAFYLDANNTNWYSEVEVSVVNKTIDMLKVSTNKAKYKVGESVKIKVEAMRQIGDKTIHVKNVSVSGNLRNSTHNILSSFSCTTGNNGKCDASVTAPSSYGDFIVELDNFKAFSGFSIIPFTFSIYMKDELGKSLKNSFALTDEARVEVRVSNTTSDNDVYTFTGQIINATGSVKKTVTATVLNSNNSFRNSFLFDIDPIAFKYGAHSAVVTVTKSGGGSMTSYAFFQIMDWDLAINKKSIDSGFEYEYSVFQNETMKFEVYPSLRTNGTVIASLNSSLFSVNLKDNLNNIISSRNVTWNATCGVSGCYDLVMDSPLISGRYKLQATLNYNGDVQTRNQIINVIEGVISAQSTDLNGNLKELFGTSEYVYLSLGAYNVTSTLFNLSDAEVLVVSYMNGSEFGYTNMSSFDLVNMSNSNYEWAWNETLQRIKLDVPKAGGLYDVYIFANNRTLGANAKFIVNPYDLCAMPKNTAGQVTSGSGHYYVWQFKTTDTIYFELKLIQATNPLGRASASNWSSSNSSASASITGCVVNTETNQVVSNATFTILEVANVESGAVQSLNVSESICYSTDSSGGYLCAVKPLSRWEGGGNVVKLKIQGQDGTTSTMYSRFEARAFYMYGYSQVWQNNPDSDLTLNLNLYEAGTGWWAGSGGLAGTVTLKKIEYQGRDGEWFWPPVDSGYNVSLVNTSTITSGTGTISLPAVNAVGGTWKTGYYRAVLQATTTSGDTDYGYAWFGVKLWDVYGQPIECTSTGCSYKNYFNSKENITLYVKISKAGSYNYNDFGGADIYGNITIGVKKIEDCKSWPCKELNTSLYSASRIAVNSSSPWYWNANINNNSNYIIQINTTTGSWGTGYYNVVLDINGTDTGYAWFNTLAFYVDVKPTNSLGANYVYNIKPKESIYFNVSTVKSYKNAYYYWNGTDNIYIQYNESDFVNTTVSDMVLRTWNQQTYQSVEYNYPEDINISPTSTTGNKLFNVSFNNGSWPAGYYWGELAFKNIENETSTGWIWFQALPFRIQINTDSYETDSDQCVNMSMRIYEPDWSSSTVLAGNYSITGITENVWTGYGNQITQFTNYTNTTFNGSENFLFCPEDGEWGGGSWGGYHYMNVWVNDNVENVSQSGYLYFRTVPFRVVWAGVSGGASKLTNQQITVPVTLTKPSTGVNTSGILKTVYQWRYDDGRSTRENYVFSVGSCYSNVSSYCTVNATQNVIIYAPYGGWRVGSNYLQAEWAKANDANSMVQDWGNIYFEGREAYVGWFDNVNSNGGWKYYFVNTENITIKLNLRNALTDAVVDATVTNVWYSRTTASCSDEWCRTYTAATFSPTTTSSGSAILQIKTPSGGWTLGEYKIKVKISGGNGISTITGGTAKVVDMTAPNLTIHNPINNQSYSGIVWINATTTENAQCYLYLYNYDYFYYNANYCAGWNVTNGTSNGFPEEMQNACNLSKYGYTGNTTLYYWASSNWNYYNHNNTQYIYPNNYLSTGGTYHTHTFNASEFANQTYGIKMACYDSDGNYGSDMKAFRVNNV